MDTIFGIPANTLLYILMTILALIGAVVAYSGIRYPLPFRLGLRNLRRRKSQTVLIIAGLALSTIIITSALGIGDTINFSVKSGVYQVLGGIDEEISKVEREGTSGFNFGSSVPTTGNSSIGWFDAAVAQEIGAMVDGNIIDGSVPVAVQMLPVSNINSNLSEAAVEIRGIGDITGEGLVIPDGLHELNDNEVLINGSLAKELDVKVGNELVIAKGLPTTVVVAGIVEDGELAGGGPAVIWPLESVQTLFDAPQKITSIYISNVGDVETGMDNSDRAIAQLETVAADLTVNEIKADQLEVAASSAELITTLFITFGTFSIFSGILLIFLIFSVLAAERKSEMGMGRAVGLQRADLVRQFVNEGLAYNFLAAAIGATLGVLTALVLAGSLSQLVGDSNLDITPKVSPRSAAIGYSLGLVITFFTVTISAFRISRVNIIAAIRDLDLPSLPREKQWTLFLRPFAVWRAAVDKTGEGNNREALHLFLLAGPKAIVSFWLGLLARGPVLVAVGYLFAWLGVNVAEQGGIYGLGVSLFIIGIGQLMAWLIVSDRFAYTFVGLALILYWSLPTRGIGGLADLGSNPGDFFISGIFLVGGAIVLFLYNADSLLNIFAGFLGRLGRLLPVVRVSIAYPVKAKGRTATTLAMFSLVVFTLVGTTTITNTFSNFLDTETGSGGYDVLVQTNPFNPVTTDQMNASIERLVEDEIIAKPKAFASAIFAPVDAKSSSMAQMAPYAINGVDNSFFATQNLELAGIAEGYEDSAAVWAALQSDPSLIVIDNFSVDRTGDPTFQADNDAFYVSSISASDSIFKPVDVQISAQDGTVMEYTIIGVLGSAPSFFGALMNTEAATNLGFSEANRYFLRLTEDSDARITANAIEAGFEGSGLQTTLLKDQLEQSRQATRSIFYLIQGFIGLGLLIGIAALGVITIRAVVERRQQIGVLRAIGFQRDMVQGVFLFEGVFIAGLGTLIGYVLALTFAYNLYLEVAADQGLAFLPPWPTLIGIAATIVVASILTTWLPARSTSKITIAEALRYE